MNVTYEREGQTFETVVENLPPKAVEYLLQYGWAQSLQDSIAGLAKAKRADLEETDDFKNGLLSEDDILAEIKAATLAKLSERAKAIVEGTIGAKVGTGKVDDITKLAREQVSAALKAKGMKLDMKTDEGKAKFAELVENHKTKNGDKLRAEIERRKGAEVEIEI